MPPPHVCIDARLYQSSGIGTLLKAALTALASTHRFEITALCFKEDVELLDPLCSQTIVMKSSIYSAREQLEYVAKIPSCALFWSPHFNVPLLPIRARRRLATVNDAYHLAHFSSLSLSQKCYAKVMYNAAFALSDCVATISKFSRDEILKYAAWRPKHIEIAYPGFDHFTDVPSREGSRTYLLSVGNVKPHKNLVRLVKAYDLVRPDEPLYIVGKLEGLRTTDTELFQVVQNSPFLRDNVHFTGHVSHERLQELYLRAKLFLFPSTYEGFGYPPFEAMSFGCPVIAASVASIPEVCEDAVEYVDPYSVESIASGMRRLLQDPERYAELARKGKSHFTEIKSRKNKIVEVIDACCRGA